MCQVKEHFVAIVRYSLSFSLSLWFRLVVENLILRLEVSVLTVTRKLETGSFLHSFVTYLIVHINFSSFFFSGQNVTGYFLILVLIVL